MKLEQWRWAMNIVLLLLAMLCLYKTSEARVGYLDVKAEMCSELLDRQLQLVREDVESGVRLSAEWCGYHSDDAEMAARCRAEVAKRCVETRSLSPDACRLVTGGSQ